MKSLLCFIVLITASSQMEHNCTIYRLIRTTLTLIVLEIQSACFIAALHDIRKE